VVSFDLDGTLWATSSVINAANEALERYMNVHHPAVVEVGARLLEGPSNKDTAATNNPKASFFVPKLMKQLHSKRRSENSSVPSDPVNLTELRKSAILEAALEADSKKGEEAAAEVANKCFLVWRNARHCACETFMFDGVVDGLAKLNEAGFVLGAITNGNADVSSIPSLSRFFSFSVTAEEVGESKPSPLPFLTAARKAGIDPNHAIGRKWVHIGDDFGNDCAAAKALEMRTVWVNQIEPEKNEDEKSNPRSNLETTMQHPLENTPMVNGVYTMESMGSGDYLAQMVIRDAVDETVSTVAEAMQVVLQWHSEFEASKSSLSRNLHLTDKTPDEKTLADTALVDQRIAQVSPKGGSSRAETQPKKFCFECGIQLPRTAKFCVDCGSKQLEL
jgi:putative hydrolase of the HAD superfamily